jgi:hypothetical protein
MTLSLVPVRDARSFAYMTVLPVPVYSRIFPTSRGSTIRGGQANSVPLSVDLADFSVSCPHSHPSDAFYHSVDVTPVADAAATWFPSLGSLSERHCRDRRRCLGRNVVCPFNSCCRS